MSRVSVKALAEFVHRRGHIHYRYQSATLAQEGVSRQAAWQRGRPGNYRRERRVTASFGDLEVNGRIDGWDADAGLVEEVKTTRADANRLHAHMGDVHLAQVRLYGAMLALECEAIAELTLRVVYLHPEDPGETTFSEHWPRAELVAYFETTCGVYAAHLAAVRARLAARDRQLRELSFPYAEFRPDQRRLAKHLYRGFRAGVDWLVEAPTGAGKTMTSVFPALKAIGQGELDRLVYLTSRTTGQRAAEDALAHATAAAGEALVAVTVTAKERICFHPGTPCDPDRCAFARGYYERAPAARRALLERGRVVRTDVEAVAAEHRVCPFELSLDAAAWADVVVCDYNYVFDPVVRLQRLDNSLFARVGLVVDEAHQLGERVRDMLSAGLPRRLVKAALAEEGLPANAARRFRAVDRALAALAKDAAEPARVVAKPEALCRAVERLVVAFATDPVLDMQAFPAAAQAYWHALRFGRAAVWAEEGAFHYLASGHGRHVCAQIACTAPGAHIRRTLAPFQGTVRQSGTLAPAALFQRAHGFDAQAPALASDGGWEAGRLGVFAVSDISTYFRHRHSSLPALAALLGDVAAATPGNALVAFPSFEYLAAVAARFAPAAAPAVRCQTPDMALAERRDFIAWLNERRGRKRVGFVVMGGVFTESVDFDSEALRLVVVVGPGLPPRSVLRDLIAGDAERAGAQGFDVAYRQPGLTRVAQTVGRIARAPGQRGVAVLVDPRFAHPAYRAFLPARWRIDRVPAAGAPAAVAGFWARLGPAG